VRLAAIDVGSNSLHMVVADVSADGRIVMVERVREMVRLGRRTFTTGRLPQGAMDLAVRTVRHFARLARARGVDRLGAVATSAVREARNGRAFVRRVRREAGVPLRVVSGIEEARLVFRAARHALGLEGGPHLLIDVGGGSVELVLTRDGRALSMQSLPLGAARLTERFFAHDPPTAGETARLERYLEREMAEMLATARRMGVQHAVGTSGTANTLVSLARAKRGEEAGRVHGGVATADEVGRLRRRLLALPATKRADLPGMDAKRVDLMPAAGLLVDVILSRTGAADLVACGWALREGLLLELAGLGRAFADGREQERRRSVEALAARFAGPNAHGRHVARLAVTLFDGTADALGLTPSARGLLEYAALLHDIGHAIDHDRHHRHSSYLVRNAELLQFEPTEVEIIAQVVRGHRKQVPKPSDRELQMLDGSSRRIVRALAVLLRVADALDRTHFGIVRDVRCRLTPSRLVITAETAGELELEVWAVARHLDLLARLLDRPVVLRPEEVARPARVRARANAR